LQPPKTLFIELFEVLPLQIVHIGIDILLYSLNLIIHNWISINWYA